MSQLHFDCLNEIFEHLESDNVTLRSCLFVNRLWCEVAVGILWKSTQYFNVTNIITLIACLPNESKEILRNNGIVISAPTPNPPMFNYASFCKSLSIGQINYYIKQLLEKQQPFSDFENSICIVEQEIFSLFMNQISSLKCLSIRRYSRSMSTLTIYPRAKYCLQNLSELSSNSDDHFYQLSQICHSLLSLGIKFYNPETIKTISNGLIDLISAQKNLKYLYIFTCDVTEKIFPLLTVIPSTLTKLLIINGGHYIIPLSFIIRLTNLQVLELLFSSNVSFEDFKTLQHVSFSQLRILRIHRACPKYEFLINFIEINGKNLREIYIGGISGVSDNSLNLAIAKFCPNLRELSVGFKSDELETLKIVFNSCQYLESINIWCGGVFLIEKDALEMVAKYSPKNFYELKLVYRDNLRSELLPEELESCFTSWANRMPQKPLSLIISHRGRDGYERRLDMIDKNLEIIEKYIKLGVIKKYKCMYRSMHELFRRFLF